MLRKCPQTVSLENSLYVEIYKIRRITPKYLQIMVVNKIFYFYIYSVMKRLLEH